MTSFIRQPALARLDLDAAMLVIQRVIYPGRCEYYKANLKRGGWGDMSANILSFLDSMRRVFWTLADIDGQTLCEFSLFYQHYTSCSFVTPFWLNRLIRDIKVTWLYTDSDSALLIHGGYHCFRVQTVVVCQQPCITWYRCNACVFRSCIQVQQFLTSHFLHQNTYKTGPIGRNTCEFFWKSIT